jgi:hypothetical protein
VLLAAASGNAYSIPYTTEHHVEVHILHLLLLLLLLHCYGVNLRS